MGCPRCSEQYFAKAECYLFQRKRKFALRYNGLFILLMGQRQHAKPCALLSGLWCHFKIQEQKSHSFEWLNYMILNLKFGGPCWV